MDMENVGGWEGEEEVVGVGEVMYTRIFIYVDTNTRRNLKNK